MKDFNIELIRSKDDEEAKKKARDARWRWIYDCLELHKKTRKGEVECWDYVAELYRSKDPDKFDNATLVSYGLDDDGDDEMFSRNELYAFLDQLVATICPPNPEVTVKARRSPYKNAAKFREILINEVFRMENLAVKLWRAVGRACIFPRCFIKTTWSKKLGHPKIRVINPHFMFFDEMASEWEDIRYVCEVNMMTRGEFMSRVKKGATGKGFYNLTGKLLKKVNFGSHKNWMKYHDSSGLYSNTSRNPQQAYKWVPVYEFYDLVSKTIYHFVDGIEQPIYQAPLPFSQFLLFFSFCLLLEPY